MSRPKKSHTINYVVLILLILILAAVQFIPNFSQKKITIIYPYNDIGANGVYITNASGAVATVSFEFITDATP